MPSPSYKIYIIILSESVLNRVYNFLTGFLEGEGPGGPSPLPLFLFYKNKVIISLSSSLNTFFDTRLRI